MSTLNTAISLRDVRVQAGQKVLLHVDALSILAGEKVAILGRNGAGKSTLLRCLNGFTTPSQGTVQVVGQQVYPVLAERQLRAVRAQVGQVLQGLHLVPRLSALENVLIGGLARMPKLRSWLRVHTAAEMELARAALQAVGVLHLAAKRADELSGGERQKVAIARMLMQQPSVVLADEPTAALDPTAADEVCKLLVQASKHATLVTVVHNTALVPLLANRVIGLKQGRVVIDCAASELVQQQLDALYE